MQIFELNEEVFGSILTNMLKRSPDSYPREEAIVADIIKNVRERGDEAVFEYTKNFDKADHGHTGGGSGSVRQGR